MGLFDFVGTFFFLSLGITFVLILLLVYHFKQRLNEMEQKSDKMFEIVNTIVKEMGNMRRAINEFGGSILGVDPRISRNIHTNDSDDSDDSDANEDNDVNEDSDANEDNGSHANHGYDHSMQHGQYDATNPDIRNYEKDGPGDENGNMYSQTHIVYLSEPVEARNIVYDIVERDAEHIDGDEKSVHGENEQTMAQMYQFFNLSKTKTHEDSMAEEDANQVKVVSVDLSYTGDDIPLEDDVLSIPEFEEDIDENIVLADSIPELHTAIGEELIHVNKLDEVMPPSEPDTHIHEDPKVSYNKMTLQQLRAYVVSRGLLSDASKVKKADLIKLLEMNEE